MYRVVARDAVHGYHLAEFNGKTRWQTRDEALASFVHPWIREALGRDGVVIVGTITDAELSRIRESGNVSSVVEVMRPIDWGREVRRIGEAFGYAPSDDYVVISG